MHIAQAVQVSTLCLSLIVGMTATTAAGDRGHSINHVKPLDEKTEERGRYLIKIAGCNDCHTAGYAEAAG